MKYAVTDIGANTVKISIYSVENGAAKHIISQSTPVGLAGYAADGVLSDTGISELAAGSVAFRPSLPFGALKL